MTSHAIGTSSRGVLGTSISRVLGTPEDHTSALGILKGGSSDPDALSVRANNRAYLSHKACSRLWASPWEGTTSKWVLGFTRMKKTVFNGKTVSRCSDGSMRLTSVGEPGTQSNRVSSATAVAAFLQDEITLGPWVITPGPQARAHRFQARGLRRGRPVPNVAYAHQGEPDPGLDPRGGIFLSEACPERLRWSSSRVRPPRARCG